MIYPVSDSQLVNYTCWRGSGGHRGEGHDCINTDKAVQDRIAVWRMDDVTVSVGDGTYFSKKKKLFLHSICSYLSILVMYGYRANISTNQSEY